MNTTLILACDKNGCIGKGGKLPWKCRSEMEYFLHRVAFKPLIMGRETCLSLHKPINSAPNYVLTRDKNFRRDGFITVNSIEEFRQKNRGYDITVVGGAQIYKLFMDYAEKEGKQIVIEVSTLELETEGGDAFFDIQSLQDPENYRKVFLQSNRTVGQPSWEANAYYKIKQKSEE